MSTVNLILINLIILFRNAVKCTIDGLNYMDPIKTKPLPYAQGEDPCNPLYWYPRNIPEYCYKRNFPIMDKPPPSHLPMPPMPPPPPPPQPPPVIFPIPPPPVPVPILPPIPYGVPISPSNPMIPVAPPLSPVYPYGVPIYSSAPVPYNPYLSNPPQAGMVPGLPGLVTKDGGINILPFSDAYSDLIENHKNQMIRKRLQKLIDEYEDFPNFRNYRRLRKYARRNM